LSSVAGRAVAAALVALYASAACSRPRAPELAPANVVLVLVDTLRADHLGAYGYARPTSPTLDRLAASGVLFTQARSVAPWTNPVISSIFTGRHPDALFEPRLHAEAIHLPLPESVPTLASKLGEAGFRTLAFVDHPGISPKLGFGRGFDIFVSLYRELGRPGFGTSDGRQIVATIGRRLAALEPGRFFLYLHLLYPHRPYRAPPPYADFFAPTTTGRDDRPRRRDRLLAAYDAEIRYTDDVVAQLMAQLESAGRLEETWVIFASDHGEGFREHGRETHGNSFYDELLHVPLLLVPPRSARIAPRRIATPVSLLDLHATVLDLAGLRSDRDRSGIEGLSLLRFLRGGPAREEERQIAEQPNSGDIHGAAILEPPWKLIRRREPRLPPLQLYDLVADPYELNNRAAAEPEIARRLDELLGRHLRADLLLLKTAHRGTDGPETLDDETIRRLKALGYLQ
jgi:arylsulfatase A-like enzyme